MSTAPAVVLVVDDHPLIRSALREVVSCGGTGGIELVEAADPVAGLELLQQRHDIDLVFLDLNFAGHDGLAYVGRFRAAAPLVPVIVYTVHEDAATLTQALASGAVGIIPKTHSPQLLQRAIQLVMEGGVYVPPQLARQLARGEPAPKPALAQPAAGYAAPVAMSDQQWKILELLAQGMPNKVIARKLGLAPSTVKNQLTMVFGALGVSNRTQAAMAARALRGRNGAPRLAGT
jgi:two-component system, NarL family, nitrate/nitrite response regulator NarL